MGRPGDNSSSIVRQVPACPSLLPLPFTYFFIREVFHCMGWRLVGRTYRYFLLRVFALGPLYTHTLLRQYISRPAMRTTMKHIGTREKCAREQTTLNTAVQCGSGGRWWMHPCSTISERASRTYVPRAFCIRVLVRTGSNGIVVLLRSSKIPWCAECCARPDHIIHVLLLPYE